MMTIFVFKFIFQCLQGLRVCARTHQNNSNTKFEIIKTYCIICLFRWELTREGKKDVAARTGKSEYVYELYKYDVHTTQAA